MRADEPVTRQRRIGRDDGCNFCVLCNGRNVGKFAVSQVRRNLQEHRNLGAYLHNAVKECGQSLGSLQIAQFFGIGRRDVDRGKLHMVAHGFHHLCKICRPVFAGFVGAKVDAHRYLSLGPREARGDSFHAFVIEPKTVDGTGIFVQPKKTRFGVSGLWQWSRRSDLNKTEARLRERTDRFGILVKACC